MERLKYTAEQILGRVDYVTGKGEQATRQAMILPLLEALGYDIWNPAEVCPEFGADTAIKKAGQKEKVLRHPTGWRTAHLLRGEAAGL